MLHSDPPDALRLPGHSACAWVLALLVLLGGCGGGEEAHDEVIRPVRVHRVELSSAVRERTFPGKSAADTSASLSFKVNGQIEQLLVSVGQRVEKGDLIAVIDETDLRLELRRAQAAYAEARAQEGRARADYQRTRILFDKESASQKQLDTASASAAAARATLEAQAQAVALAQTHIDDTRLRAPESGLIASVPVNVNENVAAGQTIAALNFGGLPVVEFNVPGSLIGDVEQGQPATVRFAALGGDRFSATVVEVGVAVGRTAYPVTVQIQEPDTAIRAGMVAEVSLRFGVDSDETRIVVPAFAVAEDAGGRFAFVAVGEPGGEGVIERRSVAIGELEPTGLEVLEGLEPGDLVVTAGIRFVAPGMAVQIQAP